MASVPCPHTFLVASCFPHLCPVTPASFLVTDWDSLKSSQGWAGSCASLECVRMTFPLHLLVCEDSISTRVGRDSEDLLKPKDFHRGRWRKEEEKVCTLFPPWSSSDCPSWSGGARKGTLLGLQWTTGGGEGPKGQNWGRHYTQGNNMPLSAVDLGMNFIPKQLESTLLWQLEIATCCQSSIQKSSIQKPRSWKNLGVIHLETEELKES